MTMTIQQNIIVNKQCACCKKTKSISEFWKRARAKDGYTSSCIECVRTQNQQSYKTHWTKNRKRLDGNHYRVTEQLREKCNQIKHQRGCHFCQEIDPICLDFHHKDKDKKLCMISKMITTHKPWSNIELEINKCLVVCANCHRKLHAGVLGLPSEL
jgi:hypothetical protein